MRAGFPALWQTIADMLQSHPRLGFDLIKLSKMPETVGAQQNPMRQLGGTINPSGAYLTHLAGDWETFYAAKRSSSTRRRDRTKRKRLGEFGEVKLINPASGSETASTLDTLMAQKSRSFARMGVGNLFAKPGHAEFYRALAIDPATKNLVHISRLDVGATPAAINLGLTYRGCYYHLLASYDDGEVSRFGPGAAHLHDLMQLGHRARVQDFRFHHRRRALQARLVRHRVEAVRFHRGGELARHAGGGADVGDAAAQALDQADAGVVERGQRLARLCRLAEGNRAPLGYWRAACGSAAT